VLTQTSTHVHLNEEHPEQGGGGKTLRTFKRDEIVYQQGDPASHWYEVVSGTVRACRLTVNGQRQLTGFYFAGDIFGLEPDYYGATAEALTDVIVRRHNAQGESCFAQAVHNAHQYIFLLGHRTASERIAAFLLMVASKPNLKLKPNSKLNRTSSFELPMPRADIADHLGLTIHTVSRTLSDFVRSGLISLDRRQTVYIHDWAALMILAGEEEQGEAP
jgi:CRP/FNR family transcriptional regulator, nitrogen fixation regulation protein